MRQRGALAVLGAVATVASLVTVGAPPAQAAPLVAPITRVGPDDLTAAIVLDISSDGRWVLAGGFGGVQRIDRIGNAATAPIATPNLDVAITDDGGTMLAVNVDMLGTVTIVRTSPGSGNVSEVVAGSLGAGNWTRSGPIAISATGRFVAFTAADSLSFRQTVAVADTQGPFTVTKVDAGLPAALARRSVSPSISQDGRYVGFTSSSAPTGCANGPGCGEVWVYDRATGADRAGVDPVRGRHLHGRERPGPDEWQRAVRGLRLRRQRPGGRHADAHRSPVRARSPDRPHAAGQRSPERRPVRRRGPDRQ